MSILELQSVTSNFGGKRICQNLSFTLSRGQCMGILGRNGAGKTTLLYNILNLRKFDTGKILIQNRDVMQMNRLELSRLAGLLFQESIQPLPATVLETVLLGRHPHAKSRFWNSSEDLELVLEIIRQVELEDLQDRHLDSLSGGERQRVAIAMLLAQAPLLYLLDEPSNHLDIDYQLKLLALLKKQVTHARGALLMASHDINLVQRLCDSVLLMLDDGETIVGDCDEILTNENLSRAYGCRISSVCHQTGRLFFPL